MAKLSLTEAEQKTLESGMDSFLSWINQVLASAPNMPHTHGDASSTSYREGDTPNKSYTVQQILLNAPKAQNGFILVPKAIG